MAGNARETPEKHPGNTRETPGKHPAYLLMFSIKGASLEKKTSLAKVQTQLEFGDNYANLWSSVVVLDLN